MSLARRGHGTSPLAGGHDWSGAVLVYFPRSKKKGLVIFYSLETNQIKKMKSRSR